MRGAKEIKFFLQPLDSTNEQAVVAMLNEWRSQREKNYIVGGVGLVL